MATPSQAPPASSEASGILGEKIPGAERLEGRLRAPCCWNQTLDIHGSELSVALRREIRSRLKAGEQPDAIEQSLIARHGVRMLAVPDNVPLDSFALVACLLLGLSAAFIAAKVLQWRRRRMAPSLPDAALPDAALPDAALPDAAPRDPLDERLDAELRKLD